MEKQPLKIIKAESQGKLSTFKSTQVKKSEKNKPQPPSDILNPINYGSKRF